MIYYTGRVVHGGLSTVDGAQKMKLLLFRTCLAFAPIHSFCLATRPSQSSVCEQLVHRYIYGYLNQCKLLTPCPAIINVHSNARRHCCWTRDHETEPLKEIWSIRLIVLPFSCNKQIKSKQPWQPAAISWKAKSVCGLFVATSYTI